MELDIPGILERCSERGGAYLPLRRRGLDALVQREWQSRGHDPMETAKRLDDSSAHIFKNRKKIRAGLVDDVFVKRYNYRGLWTAFRRSFKLPRPMRVLAGAIRLKEYEIPTPEVFAAIRTVRWGLPHHDYLITARTSPMQFYCDKLAKEFALGDPYRQFVSGVVSLMVKMHGAGVEHGDLSLRNIFCRKSPAGIYSDWGVIDLDGCKVYTEDLPESRRRRELARVISSFLRCVREEAPDIKPDVTAIIFDFARKYQELSGCNLAGSNLDARVEYLAGRVRKDQTPSPKKKKSQES